MAELTADSGTSQAIRTSFFFWMTVGMAAVVFGGFGLSYFLPMMTGSLAALPPLVHVHGFFYFSWMLLLVWQSALINQRNVALHRSLGMLGISIGTGLMIFGSIVTIVFTKRAMAESDATIYGLMYISQIAVVGFGILFFLAIRNIRDSAAHKRYILLATTAFLIGGVNRWIDQIFNLGFEGHMSYLPRYLIVDVFIIALIAYDWRTLGRIHRATIVGTAVNVVPQLLHVPIVSSAAYVSLTHWLGNLT
jgi:uncharacterized membrane protein (DUF485 family)